MQPRILILAIVLAASSTASAQVPVWDKLMTRTQQDDQRLLTRKAALGLLREIANPAGAAEIVTLAAGWIESVDQAGSESEIAADPLATNRRALIRSLVTGGGAAHLNTVGQTAAVLNLWTDVASRTWIDRDTKETAFALIADNPGDVALRRSAALVALQSSGVGQAGRLPDPFVDLIDASCAPELRGMVQASDEPGTFNFTAAAVLAEQGDTAILADLQSRYAAFEATDPRYGHALSWYIWQIQVQNPPSQLAAHIASAQLFSPQSRRWAIRKAVERNVPVNEIRQAILNYAEVGDPFGPEGHAAGLAGIKSLALQLGVLTADDLPNISGETQPAPPSIHHGEWEVSTPSVAWVPPWEPRYENIPTFRQWLQTRPWQGMTLQESIVLVRNKMCELELAPPAQCNAASQPSGGE